MILKHLRSAARTSTLTQVPHGRSQLGVGAVVARVVELVHLNQSSEPIRSSPPTSTTALKKGSHVVERPGKDDNVNLLEVHPKKNSRCCKYDCDLLKPVQYHFLLRKDDKIGSCAEIESRMMPQEMYKIADLPRIHALTSVIHQVIIISHLMF